MKEHNDGKGLAGIFPLVFYRLAFGKGYVVGFDLLGSGKLKGDPTS